MTPTTQTPKQIYYAFTSALFFISLILQLNTGHVHYLELHPIRLTIFVLLIAIVFIWIATIHNTKNERYTYLSIVIITFILALGSYFMKVHYAKMNPFYNSIDNFAFWMIVRDSTLYICSTIILITGFRSKTKYFNILPKQSNSVNWIFRILSWILQIIVWGYFVMSILYL